MINDIEQLFSDLVRSNSFKIFTKFSKIFSSKYNNVCFERKNHFNLAAIGCYRQYVAKSLSRTPSKLCYDFVKMLETLKGDCLGDFLEYECFKQ